MAEVRETHTFRAPLATQGRSFCPQYGDAQRVRAVDSGYVTLSSERQVLLKEAQAVLADSARRPAGSLNDPAFIKKQRLGSEATVQEEYLLSQPNYQVRETDLDRTLRQVLFAVKRGLHFNELVACHILNMFISYIK